MAVQTGGSIDQWAPFLAPRSPGRAAAGLQTGAEAGAAEDEPPPQPRQLPLKLHRRGFAGPQQARPWVPQPVMREPPRQEGNGATPSGGAHAWPTPKEPPARAATAQHEAAPSSPAGQPGYNPYAGPAEAAQVALHANRAAPQPTNRMQGSNEDDSPGHGRPDRYEREVSERLRNVQGSFWDLAEQMLQARRAGRHSPDLPQQGRQGDAAAVAAEPPPQVFNRCKQAACEE